MDEKKKFWQKPGEVEGFGQAFVVSEEQKLDWGDLFFMSTLQLTSGSPAYFPNSLFHSEKEGINQGQKAHGASVCLSSY
ncbi:Protein SRG1 [Vitis vinifera]|uniref:Protein SRG1 n=1 Tax=Vitis vinifera TaxID=29760 RepID=A0A438G469_VITVI|nr:Protein SRG1 [Vitis vinifera]